MQESKQDIPTLTLPQSKEEEIEHQIEQEKSELKKLEENLSSFNFQAYVSAAIVIVLCVTSSEGLQSYITYPIFLYACSQFYSVTQAHGRVFWQKEKLKELNTILQNERAKELGRHTKAEKKKHRPSKKVKSPEKNSNKKTEASKTVEDFESKSSPSTAASEQKLPPTIETDISVISTDSPILPESVDKGIEGSAVEDTLPPELSAPASSLGPLPSPIKAEQDDIQALIPPQLRHVIEQQKRELENARASCAQFREVGMVGIPFVILLHNMRLISLFKDDEACMHFALIASGIFLCVGTFFVKNIEKNKNKLHKLQKKEASLVESSRPPEIKHDARNKKLVRHTKAKKKNHPSSKKVKSPEKNSSKKTEASKMVEDFESKSSPSTAPSGQELPPAMETDIPVTPTGSTTLPIPVDKATEGSAEGDTQPSEASESVSSLNPLPNLLIAEPIFAIAHPKPNPKRLVDSKTQLEPEQYYAMAERASNELDEMLRTGTFNPSNKKHHKKVQNVYENLMQTEMAGYFFRIARPLEKKVSALYKKIRALENGEITTLSEPMVTDQQEKLTTSPIACSSRLILSRIPISTQPAVEADAARVLRDAKEGQHFTKKIAKVKKDPVTLLEKVTFAVDAASKLENRFLGIKHQKSQKISMENIEDFRVKIKKIDEVFLVEDAEFSSEAAQRYYVQGKTYVAAIKKWFESNLKTLYALAEIDADETPEVVNLSERTALRRQLSLLFLSKPKRDESLEVRAQAGRTEDRLFTYDLF